MPSTQSQSSDSSTPTRVSRRTISGTTEAQSHAPVQRENGGNREDSRASTPEMVKKRPRVSSNNCDGQPVQRKSVTVLVKTHPTEEFRSPKAENLMLAARNSARTVSTNSPALVAPTLPPGATAIDKVIAVIDYLRVRRRRPDKAIVLHYTEKMYEFTHKETSTVLDTLVSQGRLVSIKHKNGVSYRYHNTVVARGDKVTEQSNKIKAKYAATNCHSVASSKAVEKQSARAQAAKRILQKKPSTNAGERLTSAEINALKLFLRLVSPDNGVVRPSNGDEKNGIIERIRNLLPSDYLGDPETSTPGFSVYVLPPPTPISFETIEKTLKSLPYQLLNIPVINVDSLPGSPSDAMKCEEPSSGIHRLPSSLCMSNLPPIVSDLAMAILMRRRPDDGLTELWIRSPGSALRNSFTLQVLGELTDALQQASEDAPIRVVVISGVGRVFSSGIDLPGLVGHSKAGDRFVERLAERLRAFLLALSVFPKVLVAGVNGPAEGLGAAMLPLFDLVYASDTATLHTAYTQLGQVPEAGASVTLASRVGAPLANDLLLAGRRLTAREALQRGLLSDVLFPKNFPEELSLRCARIASQSSAMSLETTKCLMRMQDRERIEYVINTECRKLIEIWRTPEFRASASNYTRHCMDDFL